MRVLLVQTSFLGDTVLSTPVIAAIKALYPEAELYALTTPAGQELLRHDPRLKGCLAFDKRGADSGIFGLLGKARELRSLAFERAYVLHRSPRSAFLMALSGIRNCTGFADSKFGFFFQQRIKRPQNTHEVQRNLSLLAPQIAVEQFEQDLTLFPPPVSMASPAVREVLEKKAPYAVIAPGSVWATKMWQAEGFRAAARFLSSQGPYPVICGAAREKEHNHAVADGLPVLDLTGETTLGDLLLLIKNAALLLCNDSVALHIASAFRTKSVVVFCSTVPEFGFGPWRNDALVVQNEALPCRPCGRHGHRACPLGTGECMRIAPDEVLDALRQILRRGNETLEKDPAPI